MVHPWQDADTLVHRNMREELNERKNLRVREIFQPL